MKKQINSPPSERTFFRTNLPALLVSRREHKSLCAGAVAQSGHSQSRRDQTNASPEFNFANPDHAHDPGRSHEPGLCPSWDA